MDTVLILYVSPKNLTQATLKLQFEAYECQTAYRRLISSVAENCEIAKDAIAPLQQREYDAGIHTQLKSRCVPADLTTLKLTRLSTESASYHVLLSELERAQKEVEARRNTPVTQADLKVLLPSADVLLAAAYLFTESAEDRFTACKNLLKSIVTLYKNYAPQDQHFQDLESTYDCVTHVKKYPSAQHFEELRPERQRIVVCVARTELFEACKTALTS
ncbi:hypothetical protein JCM3770_004461, partial [Rhodotorula araucariae]